MEFLKINHNKINDEIARILCALCPFASISYSNGRLDIDSGCRMCGICVKKGPAGAITLAKETTPQNPVHDAPRALNKDDWRGIAVFAECQDGAIHPVTWELIGKARELAGRLGRIPDKSEQSRTTPKSSTGISGNIKTPVYGILICSDIDKKLEERLRASVDELYVCKDQSMASFRIEPYANAFAAFIESTRPSVVLVGATYIGRSLAPRVAARFRTGITADCTALEMRANTDLVQIRPAFGGNVMAQIVTPRHRPQFCTVRYKIFNAAADSSHSAGASGILKRLALPLEMLDCGAKIIGVEPKPTQIDISDAKRIIAVGRGLAKKEDLNIIHELAKLLGAQVACTRPLIENGWFDPRRQIGLSGRTVGAELIITIGISGSVQFMAGMRGSKCIIAINKDPNAAIFSIAHYAAVGDLYEILPPLIDAINTLRNNKS